MATRFGVEVTGKCRICHDEGRTEMHHIISVSAIERMDRPDLLTNLGNIVELCVPCHRKTDSHRYRQWREDLDAGVDPDARTKRRRKAVRMKFKGRYRCSGTTKRGSPCKYRVEEEGGFCQYHSKQE